MGGGGLAIFLCEHKIKMMLTGNEKWKLSVIRKTEAVSCFRKRKQSAVSENGSSQLFPKNEKCEKSN